MRLCASASCRREDGDRASESQRAQRCLRLPGAGLQLINRAAFWLVAKREPSSNLGSYRQLVLLLLCVPSVRLCDLLLLFSFHHPLRAPAAHVPRIIEYHIIYHTLVVNNNPAGTTRSSRTCQSPHPHTLYPGDSVSFGSALAQRTANEKHAIPLQRRRTIQHSHRSLVQPITPIARNIHPRQSRMLETRRPRQHVPDSYHPLADTSAVSPPRRP